MADAELGTTVPSAWVPRVQAMVVGTRDVDPGISPAVMKALLDNEWRDHLKRQVKDFERTKAGNDQLVITEAELESWT